MDAHFHKQKFDTMLMARDYSQLQGYVVTFEGTPEILCTGGLFPECDFAGKPLQYLGDLSKTMEQVTFSLIATERGGAFVFAWHESSKGSCHPLAASLDTLPDADLLAIRALTAQLFRLKASLLRLLPIRRGSC